MSTSQSSDSEDASEITRRNAAVRLFAQELNEATYERDREGENEARRYLLPTGKWAHRVFIVGTLVQVVDDNENEGYVRGKIRGPTGEYRIDANDYNPKALEHLRELEPPMYVAITGKVRSFDGNNGPITKISAEHVSDIPPVVYDRWVQETAERTAKRIEDYQGGKGDIGNINEFYDDVEPEDYRRVAITAIENTQEDIQQSQG